MSLEERLRTHTSAFDGLLSLIPSKYYEDAGDGDDQWRKKKQSKEEKRKAKRAKLDPSNQTASQAKDVQDAANSKTKAVIPTKESIQENFDKFNTVEGVVEEVKKGKGKAKPKAKEVKPKENGKKEVTKKEVKELTKPKEVTKPKENGSKMTKKEDTKASKNKASKDTKDTNDESEVVAPFSDLADESASSASSASSAKADSAESAADKEARLSALREKLNSKIQNMRADRKAPGTDPKKAPQSRAEILAARQKVKDARKEKRKAEREERKNAADEEDDFEDVEEDEDEDGPSLLYSQLHFENGEFSSDLKNLTSKKTGTKRDLLGQLNHVKAKRAKLAEMDQDKQKSVENATLWNRAMQHAKGEKVRDNEKMLTKAFKRQQQQKRKSEREWNDRRYTVDKHKRTKDKKRTENLQARRDSKKIKGKKVKPVKKPSSGKRAGFEGRLKSK